jgi:hypothetical protein
MHFSFQENLLFSESNLAAFKLLRKSLFSERHLSTLKLSEKLII